MSCIIEFKEPAVKFEFVCQYNKQKILLEMLLKYSQLNYSDLSCLLNTSILKLKSVYNGIEFLEAKISRNLIYLLFLFLNESEIPEKVTY